MKNSNLNNEYTDNEIDFRELLRTILNSKKFIIILTLAFSFLAFIYTSQKAAEYRSTVYIEVGSYDLLNGQKKLVEPVLSLIQNLKVNLIYKKQLEFGDVELDNEKLNFKSIEDQLLEIEYTAHSPEFSEMVIREAIRYTQESHKEILASIVNSFSERLAFLQNSIETQLDLKLLNTLSEINALGAEIAFLKNSIEIQKDSNRIDTIAAINIINNRIPALEAKIKFLFQLIPQEESNLLLLESDASSLLLRASSSPTLQQIIYTYNEQTIGLKNQIQDLQQEKNILEFRLKSTEEGKFRSEELFNLQQEKDTLELQYKSISEGKFTSEELFKIQQEKNNLELQYKLVNDQKNTTQPIRLLETKEVKTPLLIILVGTVFGFIFSIFIVLIRQVFLEEQN